jgi:hypothetical protein
MKVIETNGETYNCDAIETYKVIEGVLTPIEQPEADGFKAFTIVHVSPSEEYCTEILYRFPGHTLEGFECDEAIFIEEEEIEENL